MNITPYKIGQFYQVPCVRWQYCDHYSAWPVLGPRHEDGKLIGFSDEHYHVDFRFLSSGQRRVVDRWSVVSRISGVFKYPIHRLRKYGSEELLVMPFASIDPPTEPEIHRRRCNYAYPEYPRGIAHFSKRLEDAYACASMKAGKCPHQGAPLDGLEVSDGVVTCPLHGLRWNVETGALVRTTQGSGV